MIEPGGVYYKYLRWEHLHSFFSTGEIRIGTMFDYQNLEKHGAEVGDDEEGITTASKVVNWAGGPGKQPEFDKKFINVQADDVTISNILLRETTRSNNLYIYSVSGSFSVQIMKKLNPKYDACIVINKPNAFFQTIIRKMRSKITESAFGHCVYQTRHMPHDQQIKIHPAWLKDPRHEHHEEFRLIMNTDLEKIEPLNIYCKDAVKYCSIIYIAHEYRGQVYKKANTVSPLLIN